MSLVSRSCLGSKRSGFGPCLDMGLNLRVRSKLRCRLLKGSVGGDLVIECQAKSLTYHVVSHMLSFEYHSSNYGGDICSIQMQIGEMI